MIWILANLLAVLLVAICITVHYEMLNLLAKWSRRITHHRWIILTTLYGLLIAHIIEIWIFGIGYYVAQNWLEIGTITATTSSWFDYVYYSAMVYTTVGFGDMVPEGMTRLLTSTEALAGFLLITWSASFTFLQMQRLWRD